LAWCGAARRASEALRALRAVHQAKTTTIPIVSNPIPASNTLWPQRAMNPSMIKLQLKDFSMMHHSASIMYRCTIMGYDTGI
jgi:hypothetical protein